MEDLKGAIVSTHKSADYVAKYLGVSISAVHAWHRKKVEGFIHPEVSIGGISGKNATLGWSLFQLPELRDWYVSKHNIDADTAIARWSLVDAEMIKRQNEADAPKKPKHIHPDQTLISIPEQRTGEAA